MKKLLIICCFFLVVPAKAQNNLPVTYFNRTYDADTTIEGFASAIPLKDGYIAAGILGFNPPINKHATAMRKYDLKGNIVLEKVFEMDNYSRFMYGGSSFIQTKSGNFTMVFNITIPVYGDQVRIIHFTEACDTLWSKTYGDTADQSLKDSLVDLAQLSKPLAICEFGFSQNQSRAYDNLRLVRSLAQHQISVQYVVYWHSWSNIRVAIVDHDQAEGLLRHPHVITREQAW